MLLAAEHGLARAAFERSRMEDHRAVAVEHVLQSAFFVAARKLDERVAFRYCAVLRHAALRAPAAAGKTGFERGLERAAVHAGLPAGNDLGKRHEDLSRR